LCLFCCISTFMAAAIQVSLAGRFLHKLPPSWRYTTG
jgi:hypothetical protein